MTVVINMTCIWFPRKNTMIVEAMKDRSEE
jgi:hypothetical protein